MGATHPMNPFNPFLYWDFFVKWNLFPEIFLFFLLAMGLGIFWKLLTIWRKK